MITPPCKHQQKRETSLHAIVRYLTLEMTTQTILLTPTLSWEDVSTFGGVLCMAAAAWDKALEPILPQHTGIATLAKLASPGAPGPKGDGHSVGGHFSSPCRTQAQSTCETKEVQPMLCWGWGRRKQRGWRKWGTTNTVWKDIQIDEGMWQVWQ